jgi:DNA invertase Pin-like site-specific DNA recombinase
VSLKESAIQFDRVSSAEQLEGQSLEAQANGNQKYAVQHNLTIVKSWSVDESASKEQDRRKFMEAVQYLRDNDVKHFVFHKVDRCVRGFKGAVLIEELFDREGVTFHFTEQNLRIHKNSPAHDKTQLYFHIMFAKIYVENLKGEIKKGLDVREGKGLWNYKAPFGYKNIRNENGRASVVVDEILAPVVRNAFTLYATGNYSLEEISSFIKKSTDLPVTKRLAETILANPFYYGKIRVKDCVRAGAHDAILDERLWTQCQKIKALRCRFHVRGNGSRVLKPLMGLMKCGSCGRSVTGEAKVKANGKTYVYYHCGNSECLQKKQNVNQDDLYSQLIDAFKPLARFTPAASKAFNERMQREWDAIHGAVGEEIQRVRDKKRELASRIDLARATGSNSEIDAIMVEMDLCTVEASAHNVAETKTFKEGLRIIELLESSSKFMELGENWLEKVRLAKLVLSNCVLSDGRLQYSYQFPFDSLIELSSERNWWTQAQEYRTFFQQITEKDLMEFHHLMAA